MRQKYTGTWNPGVTEKHFNKIFYLFIYFLFDSHSSLCSLFFFNPSVSPAQTAAPLFYTRVKSHHETTPSHLFVIYLFIFRFSLSLLQPRCCFPVSYSLLKLSWAFHLWMRDTERGSICRRSRSVWVEPSTLGIRLLTINRHLVCFGPDVLLFTEIARSQRDSSPLHPNSAVILTKWGYATFDV